MSYFQSGLLLHTCLLKNCPAICDCMHRVSPSTHLHSLLPPGTLTGVSLAQHLHWCGHLLLADLLILLLLGGCLEALPGQCAQVEVHEHVAKRLHVVTATLLCRKMDGKEGSSQNTQMNSSPRDTHPPGYNLKSTTAFTSESLNSSNYVPSNIVFTYKTCAATTQ